MKLKARWDLQVKNLLKALFIEKHGLPVKDVYVGYVCRGETEFSNDPLSPVFQQNGTTFPTF